MVSEEEILSIVQAQLNNPVTSKVFLKELSMKDEKYIYYSNLPREEAMLRFMAGIEDNTMNKYSIQANSAEPLVSLITSEEGLQTLKVTGFFKDVKSSEDFLELLSNIISEEDFNCILNVRRVISENFFVFDVRVADLEKFSENFLLFQNFQIMVEAFKVMPTKNELFNIYRQKYVFDENELLLRNEDKDENRNRNWKFRAGDPTLFSKRGKLIMGLPWEGGLTRRLGFKGRMVSANAVRNIPLRNGNYWARMALIPCASLMWYFQQ